MGAANALKAYVLYGRMLGDQAIRVLAYMALVSRDGDAQPWFGLGHEAIAELALGREITGDPETDDSHLRAVRRVITQLRNAGAISTQKRATYGRHGTTNVRYLLHLTTTTPPDTKCPVDNVHATGRLPSYG